MKKIWFTLIVLVTVKIYSQEKITLDPEGTWYHEYALIEGKMLTKEQVLDFEKRYNEGVKGNKFLSFNKNGVINTAPLDAVRWYRDSRDGEYIVLSKPYPKNPNDKNSEKEWRTFLRYRMVNDNLLEFISIRNENDNSLFSMKNGDKEFVFFDPPIDGVKYIFYLRKK